MSVAPHSYGPFVADLHSIERAGRHKDVVRLRKHSGDSLSPAVYFDPRDLIWVVTALQSVMTGITARAE